MQQPCQPEGLGAHQAANQQMMLCPVRVVYETQILVNPGDQIQPNQTIFINQQQNQPPWIQNRPVQNQVIYVQQMPQALGQPSMQAINPQEQQMFIHQMPNIQNIPQMMPNMMVQQQQSNQEHMRTLPIQYTNVMPTNMIQNIQTNVAPNMNMVGDRPIMQQNVPSYVQIQQNMAPNVTNVVQQVVDHQNNPNNRQVLMNIPQHNLNQPMIPQTITQEIQAIQRNITVDGAAQVQQQQGTQMMTVNPIPNNYQRQFTSQGGQNIVQNISQLRQAPPQPQVVQNIPRQVQQVPVSTQMLNQINKTSQQINITNPNIQSQTNSGQQLQQQQQQQHVQRTYANFPYKPIQPRPQVRSNVPVTPPQNTNNRQIIQTQNLRQSVPNQTRPTGPIPTTSTCNTMAPIPNVPVNIQNQNMNKKFQSNTQNINRKRKSESPDEIQNKMVATGSQVADVKIKQEFKPYTSGVSNDVDVNTSPVDRMKQTQLFKSQANTQVPQNYVSGQSIKMEISSPTTYSKIQVPNSPAITNPASHIKVQSTFVPPAMQYVTNFRESSAQKVPSMPSMPLLQNVPPPQETTNKIMNKPIDTLIKAVQSQISATIIEGEEQAQQNVDKLVRNTVFTQARVRPCAEKPSQSVNTTNDLRKVRIVEGEVKIIKEDRAMEVEQPKEIEKSSSVSSKTDVIKSDKLEPEIGPALKNQRKPEVKIEENIQNIVSEPNPESKIEIKQEPKEEKKTYTTMSASDMKGKEIHMADGNIRREDRDNFILTHVLDGYVIQESNIAFPIRKPLKENTLYTNKQTESSGDKEIKTEVQDVVKTEKVEPIKDNSKILNISKLDLSDDVKRMEEENKRSENENPFGLLKTSTVKTWTVEQLASHLSQFGWEETVLKFREHEIDGESLFLVSKGQLENIGVSEDHAHLICEFVKS